MGTRIIVVVVSLLVIVLIIGAVVVLGGKTSSDTPSPTKTSVAAAATDDKLISTDEVVGTGAEAKAGSKLSMKYTGTLDDGTVFDSTDAHGGTPFEFTLGNGEVIKGWDQGVPGMKVGGKRKLVIPPSLGYGAQANGKIPANSRLTFEIELVSVQ